MFKTFKLQSGLASIIILIIVGIILLGAGTIIYLSKQSKLGGLGTPQQPSSFRLPKPKITAYSGGFVKIEIPIMEKPTAYRRGFIKTVLAAENKANKTITYKVYRSTKPDNDFVRIATATAHAGTKYLAVFDRDYPKNATTLYYKYTQSDYKEAESGIGYVELQQAVDEGHQPWRLDPLWVAQADNVLVLGKGNEFRPPCGGYGRDNSGKDPSNGTGKLVQENGKVIYCDVYTLVSVDENSGIAQAKVTHDGKVYIISLIKPIPGNNKIWMIKEIREIEKF